MSWVKIILEKPFLSNSRFWLLLSGVVFSALMAGAIQLLVPSGSLQLIRISQAYAFTSVFLLWLALMVGPFTKTFPALSINSGLQHARRAIGVLAFYFALLHSAVSFFSQLGGFGGISYYTTKYQWALGLGGVALLILFLMAATSFDVTVKKLTYPVWKRIHTFVYVAAAATILHTLIIGSHYTYVSVIALVSGGLIAVYLWLQVKGRGGGHDT